MRRWKKQLGIGLAVAALTLVSAAAVGWFALPALVVVPLRQVGYWYSGIASKSVTIDGHQWPYLECGDPQGTPVVMLHGFATSKDAMMSMMPAVAAQGYRVLAPDLPGFGGHAFHQGHEHTGEFYTAQIQQFMDAVGAPRAVMIGVSMGGALAAELSIESPQRVLGLALISPAGVQADHRNPFLQAVDRGENPFDIQTAEDFDRVTNTVFLKPPYIPRPLRAWLIQRALERRQDTLKIVDSMRPFLERGLQGRMRPLSVPTLVMYGRYDQVTDPSMAQEFANEMPKARIVIIGDAGHVAHYDNWPGVWTELETMLNAVPHVGN